MGNADWGAGFATGMAVGARRNDEPTYENEYYAERQNRRATEQSLLSHYSNREGVRAQRNALLKALSELAPDHPLVSPVNSNGAPGSPLLDKIFDDAIKLTFSTGLATDQNLRNMCPMLAAEYDEAQAKRKAEQDKAMKRQTEDWEREYKWELRQASQGIGFFAKLGGARPTGFPEFKDWLVQKGYVKQAGQDQANGVEQKG